jgi:hypothetical protein
LAEAAVFVLDAPPEPGDLWGLKPVPDGGEYSRCRAEKMYNSVADGRASPICPVGMRLGK